MNNKIKARLAAAAMLTASLLITPQAQAETNCRDHSRGLGLSDGSVCLRVTWRRQADGTGIVVEDVTIWISGYAAFEGGMAVDGRWLYIRRTNGTYPFSRTDGECNIWNISGDGPGPSRTFQVDDRMGTGDAYFLYKARLNDWPDDESSLHINLP